MALSLRTVQKLVGWDGRGKLGRSSGWLTGVTPGSTEDSPTRQTSGSFKKGTKIKDYQ